VKLRTPPVRPTARPTSPPTAPAAEPDERSVARTRKRFLRRQRARRWLVWRRILVILAVVGLLVGSVWLVFFSSVLAVEGARVEGVEVLTPAQVRAAADVPVGEPLATVDLDAVQARVEDLAAVDSADVSRSWPDQVLVRVVERETVAVTEREGVWKGVDDEGVLFRTYPSRPEGLTEVRMGASTSVEALEEAAAVIRSLPADILARVLYVDVRTIDAISLHLRSGATVNWGSADESGRKAEVLNVLLEREASVYDVTAPGRPTIRP